MPKVKVEIDGHLHTGTYSVDPGTMTVSLGLHSKKTQMKTQIGQMAEMVLAQVLSASQRTWLDLPLGRPCSE